MDLRKTPNWALSETLLGATFRQIIMSVDEMLDIKNKFGQPAGTPLPDWKPVARPPRTPLEGRHCRIELFNVAAHGTDLYNAYAENEDSSM